MKNTTLAIIFVVCAVLVAGVVIFDIADRRSGIPMIDETLIATAAPTPTGINPHESEVPPAVLPTEAAPSVSESAAVSDVTEPALEIIPDTEPAAAEPPQTTPTPVTDSAAPPATTAAGEITKEEAEAIALKHAGLKAEDVRFGRTEYDIERRRNEWEVEFYYGRTEFNYTINAATGEIIEYERDND
ncbi:MAG: PepSY domain-containing protein [Ruminococcus sp.]|jgi:uncharacterized membrane protein YkoI|nr:PepSY domain-containing protein [Ruminococcus sp.]